MQRFLVRPASSATLSVALFFGVPGVGPKEKRDQEEKEESEIMVLFCVAFRDGSFLQLLGDVMAVPMKMRTRMWS